MKLNAVLIIASLHLHALPFAAGAAALADKFTLVTSHYLESFIPVQKHRNQERDLNLDKVFKMVISLCRTFLAPINIFINVQRSNITRLKYSRICLTRFAGRNRIKNATFCRSVIAQNTHLKIT